MPAPRVAPCGSWKSPIDAKRIAEGTMSLAETMIDEKRVWWIELRPAEGGRLVIVRRDETGRVADCIPREFNARTRVHEYGGGAYLPVGDEVFFTNFADQRLYRSAPGAAATPVTTDGKLRYADFVLDAARARLIAVEEDHRAEGEAITRIVALYPEESGRSVPLVSGNTFYASPRVSPDGSQLAWLTWNHPFMPWDAAELWTAGVRADGSLGPATHVAGGPEESVAQPEWSPDGVLHFVSDRTNWWNLYRLHKGKVERLTDLKTEFAGPAWVLRQSYYTFDGPGRILCTYAQSGSWHVAKLDLRSLKLEDLAVSYTSVGYLRAAGGRAAFIGGSHSRPAAVALLDLATGETQELRRASDIVVDPGYISMPEPVEFPTEGGLTSHALYYAPRNKDFAAPKGELPPLVVMIHGGPTSSTTTALRLGIQYYTSRGVAVLDVNYGGSTGYGRRYRDRLLGNWGVVDVDDACNGAKFLASTGRADARRLAITGGSAGGYTVLCCLSMRRVFAAGASHFGVSDCEALAKETHKFESHYLDRLIAPYPARRDLYAERSAINHLDGFYCPVIFFQGLEDAIVLPNQAEMMVDALRKKGIPVAYVPFPGEQHGFRKAENIRRALEGEFYFFSRVLGFTPADRLEPVKIENL